VDELKELIRQVEEGRKSDGMKPDWI
jgi:hypothetical protein